MKPECLYIGYDKTKYTCRVCIHDIWCSHDAISFKHLSHASLILRAFLAGEYSRRELKNLLLSKHDTFESSRIQIQRSKTKIAKQFTIATDGRLLRIIPQIPNILDWTQRLIIALTPKRWQSFQHDSTRLTLPQKRKLFCNVSINTLPEIGTMRKQYILITKDQNAMPIFDQLKNTNAVGWQIPWSFEHMWEIFS